MKITWVNHASFVASSDGLNLICDPWIEGPAFDNGWSLLSKTRFRYDDFAEISHMWFSHEHPDHFSPPNVREIPSDFRKHITVLYHETRDKRVLKFCKSLGFNTGELAGWKNLRPDFRVCCGRQGLIDSWLAIKAGDRTLLNMNDCVFDHPSELESIAHTVGNVDVLFTQFSYANWVGNPGDTESPRRAAKLKLKQLANQVRLFKPKFVVPCASFVWFCHEENAYASQGMNRIHQVYDYCAQNLGVKAVVLYPGDIWHVGEEHDSSSALARYAEDYVALEKSPPLLKSASVPLPKLQEVQRTAWIKTKARNNRHLLRLVPPAVAYLTDLDMNVRVSMRELTPVDKNVPAEIALSSEALQYCYLFDWGGDTLQVNSRYTVPEGRSPRRFFLNFRVPAYNGAGIAFDLPLLFEVGKRYIARKLTRSGTAKGEKAIAS
jgi:UDP-MurNAc hydroxylase